jgi:hypothetical protein
MAGFLSSQSSFAAGGDTNSGKVQEFHTKWSDKTLNLANQIDSFFGNQRIEEDAQQTRIRVKLDAGYDDDGGSLGGSVSARLSLPRAEKWALTIGDLDADDEDNDLLDDGSATGGVGLRFTPKSDRLRQFSVDFGFRKPDDHYRLYVRGRHRYTFVHDKWNTRFDNKLWLYSSFGAEFDGNVYFERKMASSSLFRARTRLRWWEDDDECNGDYCPEQRFSFYQRFNSPRHALAYEWFSFFESEPEDGSSDYLDKSYFRLRYRHMTRWEWLFIEYRPRVSFKREDDYDASYDFTIRFEGIFGYRPELDTVRFGPEETPADKSSTGN